MVRAGGRCARPLHLLEEPTWPLPRQRPPAPYLRDGGALLPCRGAGGGDGFAVDASLIKTGANRQRDVKRSRGLAPGLSNGAIDEYLTVLDDAAFGVSTEATPKFILPTNPAPTVARSSSPTPPTTSSISLTLSSSMGRQRRRFAASNRADDRLCTPSLLIWSKELQLILVYAPSMWRARHLRCFSGGRRRHSSRSALICWGGQT